jgi:hypothetical protein
MTMTFASETTTVLDDAALDSVCGGAVAPRPLRVPPPSVNTDAFAQGWMFGMHQAPDGTVTCGKLGPDVVNQILPQPQD